MRFLGRLKTSASRNSIHLEKNPSQLGENND
jgi:hypothetical protein